MTHDPDLLDQPEARPKERFDGQVLRGTRQRLDPLAGAYSGGRWMRRDGTAVLYTSLAREGALAEIPSIGAGSVHGPPNPSCCISWLWRLLFPDRMGADADLEIVHSEWRGLAISSARKSGSPR